MKAACDFLYHVEAFLQSRQKFLKQHIGAEKLSTVPDGLLSPLAVLLKFSAAKKLSTIRDWLLSLQAVQLRFTVDDRFTPDEGGPPSPQVFPLPVEPAQQFSSVGGGPPLPEMIALHAMLCPYLYVGICAFPFQGAVSDARRSLRHALPLANCRS